MSKFKIGDIVVTYNIANEYVHDIIGKPVEVGEIDKSKTHDQYFIRVKVNGRVRHIGHSENQFEIFWPSDTKLGKLL